MTTNVERSGTGCTGKHIYQSRKRALGIGARRQGALGYRLYAYHCHDCHGWHLTKMPQRP